MSRADKMYKDTPEMKRDEESGKMGVTKAEKKSAQVSDGTDGMQQHEEMPPHVRHAHERRDMHHRHETEHMIHDNGKGGSKEELHSRHEKEMKDMHKRHEKDSSPSKGSGSGAEKISKVEKGKE